MADPGNRSLPFVLHVLTLLGIAASFPIQAQQEASSRPIESIMVWGRGTELLGTADSASQGLVGNADFSTRPLSRVGELAEVVPGMIATQHSGSGKANQYFLRGINLDHGSDFTAIFEGMPVNFPSHAHATGYLDLNFFIPEIIETVEFHKGTYYVENGDFSAAGSSRFKTYDRVEQDYVKVSADNYAQRRVLGVASADTAVGSFLYAGEFEVRDGPWDLDEDLRKFNGFAKYTGTPFGVDSQLILTGYDSKWNSSDQIPLREVQNGNLSRFGFVDPSLGGKSFRYNLIGNFDLGSTDVNVYGSRYGLNLFSNPTLFLNDPVNGDGIEQEDRRWVFGSSIKHSQDFTWGRRSVTPLLGLDLRYDDIGKLSLFRTAQRERIGVTRNDAVQELSISLYAQTQIQWTDSFRTTFGVRGELYNWDVNARREANSGSGSDAIVLPKFSAAWIPMAGYELYVSYGQGFHSNDVRGAEIRVDPVSGDPTEPVDVLVRAKGGEIGIRAEPVDGVNLTLAGFWMDLASELVFVGDAGTSEPKGPTRRRGLELTGFWEMNDWLVLDFNTSVNHSRFKNAPAGMDRVQDALKTTASAGLTLTLPNSFVASFRMRHFGDAPLEETGTVRKPGTTLYNLGLSYDLSEHLQLGLDVLNVFDARDNDIVFFFESQLQNEAAPVADLHFHPVEPRTWRGSIRYHF
ncbi:MAG: TonB-dependent receptor [Pseudomonadales bacterium]|nr:TonB-dependent receptor [Pseudomonadales bacterium]